MSFQRPPAAPDWADTVTGPMRRPGMTAREAFLFALERPPLWLRVAMVLRNIAVAPFRLKTGLKGKGHFLARMPVVADKPEHFETGMADRHLTFTIATLIRGDMVGVTTAIWFNSWLGRVYLRLVMPGHILATRQIAGRIAHPLTRHLGEFSEGLKA